MSESLVFDQQGVMDRVDNDRELLGELVGIFSSEAPGMIEAIKSAIQSGDAAALDASAHSIKSALGNIGAMEAHALAFKLELAGKKGEFSGVESTFEEFLKAIEAFKVAYQEFMSGS